MEDQVNLEEIRQWINDPHTTSLSTRQQKVWERLDFAYDQLKIEGQREVLARIQKKFGVSRTQAQRDVAMCQNLLAPVMRLQTDWLRNFIVEDAMLQIKVAREMLDHKAWHQARETLTKIVIAESQREAPIDPKMLGNNQYYAVINIGGNVQKIDLAKLNDMPVEKRQRLTDFLFQDVEEEEAIKIMNS
jgi:hypothetical protein